MHTYTVDNEKRAGIIATLGAISLIITLIINGIFDWLQSSGILSENIFPNSDLLILLPSLFVTFSIIFTGLHEIFQKKVWNRDWIPSIVVSTPDLTGEWEGFVTVDARSIDEHIDERSNSEDGRNPTNTGQEPENDEDTNWKNDILANTSNTLSGSWIGEKLQNAIVALNFENDKIDAGLKIEQNSRRISGEGLQTGVVGSDFENGRIEATLTIEQNWRTMSIDYEADKSRSYSKVASFRRTEGPYPEFWYMYENIPDDPIGSYNGTARLVYINSDEDGEELRGEYFNAPAGTYSHGKVYFEVENEGE